KGPPDPSSSNASTSISVTAFRPLDMTNIPPNKQSGMHDIDDGDSNNTPQHTRKRDKVREFLGIPKSKDKDLKSKTTSQSLNAGPTPQAVEPPLVSSQATGPSIAASQATGPIGAYQTTGPPIAASQTKNACSDDNKSISSSVAADTPLPSPPPPPTDTKRFSVVFTENLTKPALRTDLPTLLDRIEKTEQLLYCNALLIQASSLTTTAEAGEGATNTTTIALQMKPTLTDKELKWLAEMDKNPM
ncbi:hypothetical protein BGZ95_008089, partial [Linnemannia exigua]